MINKVSRRTNMGQVSAGHRPALEKCIVIKGLPGYTFIDDGLARI